MAAPAKHVGEAGERACGDAIELAPHILDARLHGTHAAELEATDRLAQETHLLAVGIDQQDFPPRRRASLTETQPGATIRALSGGELAQLVRAAES